MKAETDAAPSSRVSEPALRALPLFLALSLRSRARRLVGLSAFGLVFLAAGATARIFTGREHGHVELDMLFEIGGTTLVSVLLLLGWLIGRFPMIAVLVLMSGIFSDDRAHGHARLYAVRPSSILLLYGMRMLMFAVIAFAMSAVLIPGFDLLILNEWSGTSVFALIAAQIMVYASLTALLSMATRADAWIALFLGILATVWYALRRVEFLQNTPSFVRETISVLLPPQGALLRVEAAFANSLPVPADAMLYILIYAVLVLLLAGVGLARREL
ncbi:MAG: hypothetical protein KFH98_13685 [Gemmatimonadetes bacterium]|nr:hypothetical protein [Gemmatimonadota bacterium]